MKTSRFTGSPPISRTLTRRPIEALMSTHVEAPALLPMPDLSHSALLQTM